jgi:MYXO-CTERM domain-containing protein
LEEIVKRGPLSVCASLLLVGLMSGSAMAGTTPALSGTYQPGNIDQSNWSSGNNVSWNGGIYAQTFTVGETGVLWWVELCTENGGQALTISIEDTSGGAPNGNTLGSLSDWSPNGLPCQDQIFDFSASNPPVRLVSGTMYAIVFTTIGDAVFGTTTSNTYSSGSALQQSGSSWSPMGTGTADFEFQTRMEDTVAPTVDWDKPSVTAGTTTPLTLNGSILFTNGRAGSLSDAVGPAYLVDVTVPSWYKPSSVSCSDSASHDLTADCTISSITNTSLGVSIPYVVNGDTVTFQLVGSASPALSDVGTSGTGYGQGCFTHQYSADALYCADATAEVAVAAGSAPPPAPIATPTAAPTGAPAATPTATRTFVPTPPPTNATAGSSDNSSTNLWLLTAWAFALLGAATAFAVRRRRTAA